MTRHLLAAARRGEPWLIALIGGLLLALTIAAIAWTAHHAGDGPAAPAPRPQPAPTAPLET